jgi:signal transduction histidine kinase
LVISEMIVKKLGGEISMESKEKEGTKFTFAVKLHKQESEIL